MEISVILNSYNACRTNTGRAATNDGHYDLMVLSKISGVVSTEDMVTELQWCAEHGEDDLAKQMIINLAEAYLSAYEIQSQTYKNK